MLLQKLSKSKNNLQDWAYGIDYRIVSDDSVIIWDKLGNLSSNALQAMLAVFVILFIMLSWREALIAGLSIPLTFLGTLFILWLTGTNFK